ncbi:MAG: PAS domain-containing protein [Magnetococcales bacterium]|nr:PAS domain-containing protein [Magnetococcales bacterium]
MTNKRTYKLSTLILGIATGALLLVSIIFISVTYITTQNALNREISRTFDYRNRIIEISVLDILEGVDKSIDATTAQIIIENDVTDKNIKIFNQKLTNLLMSAGGNQIDLLTLVKTDKSILINLSSPLISSTNSLLELYMDEFWSKERWQMVVVNGKEKPNAALLKSLPVVEQEYGQVVAYIVYGVSLTDNIPVANTLKKSARVDKVELLANTDVLSASFTNKITKEDSVYLSRAKNTNFNYGDKKLIIRSHLKDSIQEELDTSYKNNLIFLGFVAMFVTFASFMLIRRITTTGFGRLMQYAYEVKLLQGTTTPLSGSVEEFNVLGSALEEMIASVSESEAALRESETRFSLAMQGASDGLWDWDLESDEVYFSPRWKNMLGYEENELKNHPDTWRDNLHPDDKPRTFKIVDEYLNQKINMFEIEFRMRHKNGHFVPILSRGYVVRDNTGKPTRFVGTHIDITEQRRNELRLKQSEQQFRTLVSNIPGVVYRCALDEDWTMYYISDAIENITGYPAKDFVNNQIRTITSVIHPDDRDMVSRIVNEAVEKREDYLIEYRFVNRDGHEVWVYEKGRAYFADKQSPLWLDGAIFDITQRKNLEAQILHSQKMEAIGTLTGGIAHDFNNILGIIKGNVELAMMGVNVQEMLQNINIATNRGRDLILQLLTFSRKSRTAKQIINLVSVSKEVLKLIRPTFPASIKIDEKFYDNDIVISADPTQINQVLMNLLTNANQAIGELGGTITVKVNKRFIDNVKSQQLSIKPGDYAEIVVEDSGPGMSEELQARVFEPFFTTKSKVKGTGLGLSVVHGVIKASDGSIEIESELGRGTAFKVYLPVINNSLSKEEE